MQRFLVRTASVCGRLTIVLGIGIAVLLFQAQAASAYSLLGVKWGGQPSPGVCCASLDVNLSGTFFSVDITGWQNGVAAWNNSPALIYYIIITASPPIHLSDTYASGTSWDGITYWGDDGQYFIWATAYLNNYYTQNYSTSKIQGVAAHELGHVAGLDETGACPAVMWHVTNSSCRATVPQTDDINGIDALY